MEVSGEVVLPDGSLELPSSAVVRVRIEDVTRADADARLVASVELRAAPGGERIPFLFDVPQVDPTADYSVRVHVDLDGRGEVDVGDLVSVQSYPVLTRGHGNRASVEVRRVN